MWIHRLTAALWAAAALLFALPGCAVPSVQYVIDAAAETCEPDPRDQRHVGVLDLTTADSYAAYLWLNGPSPGEVTIWVQHRGAAVAGLPGPERPSIATADIADQAPDGSDIVEVTLLDPANLATLEGGAVGQRVVDSVPQETIDIGIQSGTGAPFYFPIQLCRGCVGPAEPCPLGASYETCRVGQDAPGYCRD